MSSTICLPYLPQKCLRSLKHITYAINFLSKPRESQYLFCLLLDLLLEKLNQINKEQIMNSNVILCVSMVNLKMKELFSKFYDFIQFDSKLTLNTFEFIYAQTEQDCSNTTEAFLKTFPLEKFISQIIDVDLNSNQNLSSEEIVNFIIGLCERLKKIGSKFEI